MRTNGIKIKQFIPKKIRRIIKILFNKSKELFRFLRYAVLPKPKRYKDVVSSYEKYLFFQKNKYCSFESENPKWKHGQQRYLSIKFEDLNRDLKILDIACGDGVGLKHLRNMGFKNIMGVELNETKASIALQGGFNVISADMHNLHNIDDKEFDVVYSSHTLEHAYEPGKVVNEFNRILKKTGLLIIVLPYPDLNIHNDEAHGGKYELGTNVIDNGETVVIFFKNKGFNLIEKTFDNFREPEIWLTLKKYD